jgi:hypothetical protein
MTMNYRKNLMTGLIGLALLAMPIAAAAQDPHNGGRNDSHPAQAQSHHDDSAKHSDHAQARSNDSGRKGAPEAAKRNESRDERSARTENRKAEPETAKRNENRGERNTAVENRKGAETATRDEHNDRNFKGGAAVTTNEQGRGDRNYNGKGSYSYNGSNDHGSRDYRNYGAHEFDHDREYAAGGWVMPDGYAGGACAWAQHLRNVYQHDEYTGHPAAASDVLWQLRRAERNCGVPYGYNVYPYPY